MTKILPILCLVFSLLLLQGSVQAQLLLDITPSTQTGNQGATLPFAATLTNISATDTIDLTGSSGSFVGPSSLLTWDDTSFLSGLPLSLAPGASYTENLFAVIDLTAIPGSYTGAYSVDGSTPSSLPVSGADNVSVTVQSPLAAVPEPGNMAFAASAVGGLGWLLRRRQLRKSKKG